MFDLYMHYKAKFLLLLYWHNGLLKNRVGTCVGRFLFLFLYPAVCPFVHTYPVYIFIKT